MSFKFGPIFHVGYAVPDMDKALAYWTGVMGVGPFFIERHITGDDEEYIYKGKRCVQDVTVAHAYTGELDIELICPNLIAPSPVCDFLEHHPDGGAQHLGVLIDDWDRTLALPEVQRHLVLEGHAGNIRIAFVDGFPMGATALEFIEASDEIRAKFGRLKKACNDWDGRDPIRGKA
jgi:catechol 2,3-dioxygenase-like lactoylglutathione lyase family enzyme